VLVKHAASSAILVASETDDSASNGNGARSRSEAGAWPRCAAMVKASRCQRAKPAARPWCRHARSSAPGQHLVSESAYLLSLRLRMRIPDIPASGKPRQTMALAAETEGRWRHIRRSPERSHAISARPNGTKERPTLIADPTDSARLARPDSARACRSLSWPRRCDPAAPGWSGCRSRGRGDVWRTSAGAYGRTPAW
jgi:hypothetical protein